MSPATTRKRRARLAAPKFPIERSTLACGAGLLVSPRAGAPVCAVQVHIRGGHSLDPAGREGTAFLAGALVDQGTSSRTEEEIAALLEPAGGSVHGDSTGISGTIAGADWKLLLDVVSDMLTDPVYPREKVGRQKARLLERLMVEREEPRVQATRIFKQLTYGDHWLGRPEHGSLESVSSIERSHLRTFHRRNWVAKRALVSVCGDVDPKKVRRHLDRRLSAWEPGRALAPREWTPPPPALRTGAFRADRQQVHVYLGHLGVRRSDPDYPGLVVMDHILGTGPGFTSRITRRLRDELGLAYTVSASISSSAGVLPGLFTAYIGTSPEHVATAIEGFLQEMRRIREEEVSRDELELARNYLLGSFVLGFERASRRAGYLIYAERNGLPDGHLDTLLDAFAAVDADDVRRVAATHLLPATPCVAAAGPLTAKDLAKAVRAATRSA